LKLFRGSTRCFLGSTAKWLHPRYLRYSFIREQLLLVVASGVICVCTTFFFSSYRRLANESAPAPPTNDALKLRKYPLSRIIFIRLTNSLSSIFRGVGVKTKSWRQKYKHIHVTQSIQLSLFYCFPECIYLSIYNIL
jgi:hypothetical protein